MNIRIKKSQLKTLLFVGISLPIIFLFFSKMSSLFPGSALQSGSSINLLAIFLTGLFTGGLTCLAVQGGLLAATIAQREEEKLAERSKKSANALPILSFLVAKLVAYTALGLLLGSLGSVVQLSLTAKIVMQVIVVIFMLGTALNILNVHPLFRYFALQPPKFLTRLVRKQSKSKTLFAPALLGAFTVFIPCGTTQAMMALAIGSGSPVLGAAVMFAFVLGTSPLFFTLGYFATKLGDALHQKFMKVAAYALILLALFNLNGVLALSGSNFTLNTFACLLTDCNNSADQSRGQNTVSEATIQFNKTSYSPNMITVKAGSSVKLNLVNNTGEGCVQAFTIPKLGVQKIVRVGSTDSVQFDAPAQPTQLAFMCSMGMYRGVINVI